MYTIIQIWNMINASTVSGQRQIFVLLVHVHF